MYKVLQSCPLLRSKKYLNIRSKANRTCLAGASEAPGQSNYKQIQIKRSRPKPTHKQDARFAPNRQALRTSNPNRARCSCKVICQPNFLELHARKPQARRRRQHVQHARCMWIAAAPNTADKQVANARAARTANAGTISARLSNTASNQARHMCKSKFLKRARNTPPPDPSTTETNHAKASG